jgi:DNA-binding NarL/FixJ family response regulator
LALLGEGKSNREIGGALGISEGTAKLHVAAILRALGAANRTEPALLAARA